MSEKDKSIESEYDLNEKDKKKYDKLNREIKFDNPYGSNGVGQVIQLTKY